MLQALADVASGLSMPNHVRNVGGGVVEGSHANAWVMGGGEKRITRAQACAHDAKTVVTLLLEPIEAAAYVNHRLAAGVDGASDVGGYCVIRAADVSRHANVVIGHCQPQHCDTQQIQNAAESGVGDSIRVPVWQQDHRAPTTCGKPARIYQIILR